MEYIQTIILYSMQSIQRQKYMDTQLCVFKLLFMVVGHQVNSRGWDVYTWA
jgi:hypothetical protein